MSNSKSSATRPAKDNMLDFSTGEDEDFMDACVTRVHAYGLSEEQKMNLDLATLFDERDWESIASTLPKRTALHTQIYHRNNQNDIHELLRDMLKRMPPTPPGSGASSPKSKKRGRELEVDMNGVDRPQQKRQTTESTSPKAQEAEASSTPSLSSAHSLNDEELLSGELLTPSAPDATHLSGMPIKAHDGPIQASAGEAEQQTEVGSHTKSGGADVQLGAQLDFLRQQLARSEKRRQDELEAQKNDYEQQLTDVKAAHAKTLESKAAEYATLESLKYGSDRSATIAEEQLEKAKDDHRRQVRELRESRQQAKDDARVEVARIQKELGGVQAMANAQQMLITEVQQERKKVNAFLLDEQRRSGGLRSQLNKLRERAGLDEQGTPKPKQCLAFYGPVPDVEGLFHRERSELVEVPWQGPGLYKRHGFAVPVYYGGGVKESEAEVSW
ncbi:hypothetical protein AC579_4380 [Pseudocercospora musae]|uniref:Uncharacterized protein n=1 Tax=Pseudocercospora musae TaxID=113226 RepID=A0A139HU49_9PEZI|nr:hypothetical protein AC579_4380 [Pseudocercospora musae]